MSIMKLCPAVKEYLWGGTRLIKEYGKDFGTARISETWECSVHPDGLSTVTDGEYKGCTLERIISGNLEYLGKNNQKGFPVLVKFIDADKDLSVQVHPDDSYARIHENQNGKNEMWYVLDAEENAELIYGFEEEISLETARRAVYDGTIMDYLHHEKVSRGDVFYIPSGTVHAIGRGVVIAEIQENSNVTYRVYDYDRKDENGSKRELHIEKALDVMSLRPAGKIKHYDNYCECPEYSAVTLCRCRYFTTDKIAVRKSYSFSVDDSSFQIMLFTDGAGTIKNNSSEISVKKGDCIFIPADTGKVEVTGKNEFLKIKC
ncbi:MAG: class I mannose-6-phosphate isomerase [Ruminococcus flavefaciens]|nr:class I mannose-6-phosphate isomerase [Ruminococcus flavefaciens]